MASRKTTTTSNTTTYPFMSKAQVGQRLTDEGFVLDCLRIMVRRTEERDRGRAPRSRRWGWAAVDLAKGAGVLAGRLLRGEPAYGDKKKAAILLARYTVQIAEALRLQAMVKTPELVQAAKVYGVAPVPKRGARRSER